MLLGKKTRLCLFAVILTTAALTVSSSAGAPANPVAAGTTHTVSIPAIHSHFAARDAKIYLPPAYGSVPLPVLIMLAGIPGSPDDWFEQSTLRQDLDDFAAQHNGRAPVVITPDDTGVEDEDLLCMDSPRAKVDEYLSKDVPTWVAQHLDVEQNRATWAVGGLSYGGTCAFQLAVRHPDLFPTFLDFSGEDRPTLDTLDNAISTVFNGDTEAYSAQDPLQLLKTAGQFAGSAGFIAVGDNDDPYTSEQDNVVGACVDADVQVRSVKLPGEHDWTVWSQALDQSFPWLMRRMGLMKTENR